MSCSGRDAQTSLMTAALRLTSRLCKRCSACRSSCWTDLPVRSASSTAAQLRRLPPHRDNHSYSIYGIASRTKALSAGYRNPARSVRAPVVGTAASLHPDQNGSGANGDWYLTPALAPLPGRPRPSASRSWWARSPSAPIAATRDTCRGFGAAVIAEMLTAENLAYASWWGGRGWKKNYLFRTPATAALPYVRMITGR